MSTQGIKVGDVVAKAFANRPSTYYLVRKIARGRVWGAPVTHNFVNGWHVEKGSHRFDISEVTPLHIKEGSLVSRGSVFAVVNSIAADGVLHCTEVTYSDSVAGYRWHLSPRNVEMSKHDNEVTLYSFEAAVYRESAVASGARVAAPSVLSAITNAGWALNVGDVVSSIERNGTGQPSFSLHVVRAIAPREGQRPIVKVEGLSRIVEHQGCNYMMKPRSSYGFTPDELTAVKGDFRIIENHDHE